jgi:hypothetical protein
MREKLTGKFLLNVLITAAVAGASAALNVIAGGELDKALVIAAGIVFIRVAAGVAAAALGKAAFPGQLDEPV